MPRNRKERFIQLADKRVAKTVKMIESIGNLSNKSNYKYTEEQSDHICGTLLLAIDKLTEKFDDALDNFDSKKNRELRQKEIDRRSTLL